MLELATIQEVANETEAIAALSCRTCQLLSLRLWNDMVAWVDANGLLPSVHAIESYGTELCQNQVRKGGCLEEEPDSSNEGALWSLSHLGKEKPKQAFDPGKQVYLCILVTSRSPLNY